MLVNSSGIRVPLIFQGGGGDKNFLYKKFPKLLLSGRAKNRFRLIGEVRDVFCPRKREKERKGNYLVL